MDLKQTLEYQQTAQSYLEDNDVYDLFEYLLRQILIDRPQNPLDYLISKLQNPRRRRLIITGGSGNKRRQVSRQIAARFKVERISVIQLLKDQVKRAGQWATQIQQSWQLGVYVPDQIVLDLLMPVIGQTQKQDKSYLLQGCPRTRVQSLALLRAGIIPDRVLVLEPDMLDYRQAFKAQYVQLLHPQDLQQTQEAAQRAVEQYTYNIRGVKEVYKAQHHEIDGKSEPDLIVEAATLIFLMKGRSSAPRKPPRIILLGPPGSGRSTQAQSLSKRYGLTLVSTSQLLRDQIYRKTEIGKSVGALIQAGELVPDHIITEVVRQRLLETDCKMNGWVLDGFPKTLEQSRGLKEFKITPTHVFFLEGSDELVYERLENRCLDPVTGIYYSKASLPQDIEVASRLISLPEDGHDAVRKRLVNYKEHATKLHAEYARHASNIKADIESVLITEMMGDAIENSIPHDFE